MFILLYMFVNLYLDIHTIIINTKVTQFSPKSRNLYYCFFFVFIAMPFYVLHTPSEFKYM